MADHEKEKENAAEASVKFVCDGMLVGLGSGSTAAYMVRMLGKLVRSGLSVEGVPTSNRTKELAEAEGIRLRSLEDVSRLDMTIDGADEFDPGRNLIKGGRGALLREKVVASISDHVVIIVDSRKRVRRLGAFPLPVEVIPFGWKPVAEAITRRGSKVVRREGQDGRAFVTDEGNFILDCAFDEIRNPQELAVFLDALPGVVEHGLFLGLADTIVLGIEDRVEIDRGWGRKLTFTVPHGENTPHTVISRSLLGFRRKR